MRFLTAILTAAALALPAAASSDVPLTPYIGGRVVVHVPQDTGWHLFSPDPSPTYTFQWPGTYFEARFTGDTVAVKVDDAVDNLYVLVDGSHKLTLTRPGQATVSLDDLGDGSHTIRLEKASETQAATGTFDGFFVPSSSDTLPPPVYDRAIEFIGDSYTVGYGNTSRGQTCSDDDVRDTTDTSQAFAPAVAKHFNAAYRIMAFSGRGIVRNYGGGNPGLTLPYFYDYALFDRSVPANDAGWSPDAVVIALGTNDFSTDLTAGEKWTTRDALRADYVTNYVAFVQKLRAKYPAAHFILMTSGEKDAFSLEFTSAVNAVADAVKAAGDGNLEVLPYSGLDHMACQFHPSLKDDALLANLLIGRISLLPKFAPAATASAGSSSAAN